MRIVKILLAFAICAAALVSCSERPANSTKNVAASAAKQETDEVTVDGVSGIKTGDGHVLCETAGVEVRLNRFDKSRLEMTAVNNSSEDRCIYSCYIEADGVVYPGVELTSTMLSPGGTDYMQTEFPGDVRPLKLRIRFYCADSEYTDIRGSLTDVIEIEREGQNYLTTKTPYEEIFSDEEITVGYEGIDYTGSGSASAALRISNKTDRDIVIYSHNSRAPIDSTYADLAAVVPAGGIAEARVRMSSYLDDADIETLSYVEMDFRVFGLEDGMFDLEAAKKTEKTDIFIPILVNRESVHTEETVEPEGGDGGDGKILYPAEDEDAFKSKTLDGSSELKPVKTLIGGKEADSTSLWDGNVELKYICTYKEEYHDSDDICVCFKATNHFDKDIFLSCYGTVNGAYVRTYGSDTVEAYSEKYLTVQLPVEYREIYGEITDVGVGFTGEAESDSYAGIPADTGLSQICFSEETSTLKVPEDAEEFYSDDYVTIWMIDRQQTENTVRLGFFVENKTDSPEIIYLTADDGDEDSALYFTAFFAAYGNNCALGAKSIMSTDSGDPPTLESIKGLKINVSVYDAQYQIISEGEAEL